jgi:hypothetical protein
MERARAMVLKPKETWEIIKKENLDAKQILINYALPLALVPAVCNLIAFTLIGIRLPGGNLVRAPFLEALSGGIIGYVLHVGGLLAGSWVASLLAPTFASKSDFNASVEIVAYSMTPVWLAGIFSLLPGLGILSILGLYGVYLLALGLPVILETPENKVFWYTLAIVISGMAISFVLSLLVVGVFYGPMYLRMMAR